MVYCLGRICKSEIPFDKGTFLVAFKLSASHTTCNSGRSTGSQRQPDHPRWRDSNVPPAETDHSPSQAWQPRVQPFHTAASTRILVLRLSQGLRLGAWLDSNLTNFVCQEPCDPRPARNIIEPNGSIGRVTPLDDLWHVYAFLPLIPTARSHPGRTTGNFFILVTFPWSHICCLNKASHF